MSSITLRVPATSANIGPGFDTLGLALTLYAEFDFSVKPYGLSISGCPEEYRNENNLAVQAYREVERMLGVESVGLSISIHSDIPVSRGLGSSASLLAAGAMAANVLNGSRLTRDEILGVVSRMEGHPDNAAAAIYGSLCASMLTESGVRCVRYDVHESLGFAALIPDFMTSTHEARRALPKAVGFSDATYNLSRLAVLLRALELGDTALIGEALNDKLHQRYRGALIRGFSDVREMALASGGCGFCISGSGSTCLAILKKTELNGFCESMQGKLSTLADSWRVLPLDIDIQGASIVRLT